jgi:hypothetical protein
MAWERRFIIDWGPTSMQIFVLDDSLWYQACVLDGEVAIDVEGSTFPVMAGGSADQTREIARLVPWREPDGRRGAVLLSNSGRVVVDGRSALPLTVLWRGSEIRVGKASLFFSDEAPLEVVPFAPPEGARPAECTRCHGPIQPGDPVVHCPICAVVYMAQPDKSPNCWEFGPCLVCGRDPHLEFSWHPEGMIDPHQPVTRWGGTNQA